MKYDDSFFSAGINRQHTNCVKWDAPVTADTHAIPMWVADMDFPCEEAIAKAMEERAKHLSFGYTMEDQEGKQAFCDFWQRRHNLTIEKDQTVMMPCVVTGLRLSVIAFSKAGDEVAINTPVYGPFYKAIRDSGRVIRECPMIRREDFSYDMDFSAIEKAFLDGVKLMILCNPHNPVGRAWRKEELEKLLDLAEKYDVRIVSDEIHADFVYEPVTFVPMLSLPKAKARVLSMASASKTFNIAGLHQAQAISYNPDMLKAMADKMNMFGVVSGNIFAMAGTRAAYEKGDDWLNGLLSYLSVNRFILRDDLHKYLPKAKMTPLEATYLAWVDLSAYGMEAKQMREAFRESGVVFSMGEEFGEKFNQFIRINIGCPRAQLQEAVVCLARAMGEKEI